MFEDIPPGPWVEGRKADPRERIEGFDEVEKTLTEEEAMEEAGRCLGCGVCVECLSCVRACEVGAIDHEMKGEVRKIKVGQILVATGYDTFDPRKAAQYGYGRLDNVLTSLEFERMLSSTGPTGGKVLCKNGNPPRAVAILHCIGSRDENYHRYCSRVCCMYALKFAHLVKERTEAEVYQFYIDMRAYGKGFEEFYRRVLLEGSNVIRERWPRWWSRDGPERTRDTWWSGAKTRWWASSERSRWTWWCCATPSSRGAIPKRSAASSPSPGAPTASSWRGTPSSTPPPP